MSWRKVACSCGGLVLGGEDYALLEQTKRRPVYCGRCGRKLEVYRVMGNALAFAFVWPSPPPATARERSTIH